MHVTCVVGARPNFMKIAPILHAAAGRELFSVQLVHTGQHYDEKMSGSFFRELGIPQPNANLGVGSGNHAQQTANVMLAFDNYLAANPTELVLVVGDVNSTLACALVASKRGIAVAHVEAGLRSFDRAMPEETNRIVTDHISDLLFVTEPVGIANLRHEGIPDCRMFMVGNVMIDSLFTNLERAKGAGVLSRLSLEPGNYAVCTLHRPSNVDDEESALRSAQAVMETARRMPTVFPVHPRTRSKLEAIGKMAELQAMTGLRIVQPLGYLEFLALMSNARCIVTDSGGIQEETTALGIPCFTYRNNTERPITVSVGTNELVGADPNLLAAALDKFINLGPKQGAVPEGWDGHAADRILDAIEEWSASRDTASAEAQRDAGPAAV